MFQVSWIRTRDIRVLSIGRIRYTQDTRFTPLHEEGNDVWVLKVRETRMSDSGLYECQVSYHDDVEKKLKKPVKLLVLGKTFHSAAIWLKMFRNFYLENSIFLV